MRTPRGAVQDALIGLYPRWEQVEGGAEAHARRRILNANVSRCRKFGAEALPLDPDITRADPSSPFAAVDDEDAAVRLFAGRDRPCVNETSSRVSCV